MHGHGGTPTAGWFNGKSHLEMDDEQGSPILGNLHITYGIRWVRVKQCHKTIRQNHHKEVFSPFPTWVVYGIVLPTFVDSGIVDNITISGVYS